jgi:hypothetical protein
VSAHLLHIFGGMTMRFVRIFFSCALLVCSARFVKAQENPGKRVVGIMPVFDTSGDSYGQQFAQNLTAMVYEKLEGAPFQVMLLNPGGLYSPLIPESMLEYAQSAGVDTVLVTTLQPTDKPQKGDFILHVEAKLMDAQSAKEMAPSTYSAKVSHNDALLDAAKGGLDFGSSTSNTVRHSQNLYSAMVRTNGSRPFEKQPLGKAALGMADSIRSQVLTQAARADKADAPKGGACTITLRVQYLAKKASSRAFDIIVNGESQSLWTKDGVTTLENLKAGPVFLQVSVADPPYRTPVQDLYQANTILDCSHPERQLSLDIGPVGDALLHWR